VIWPKHDGWIARDPTVRKSSSQYRGIDKVLIVTTNEYTQQAKELAQKLNVKLINGDELVQLISEYELLDLVAKYLDFIETAPIKEEIQQAAERRPPSKSEDPQSKSEASTSKRDSLTGSKPDSPTGHSTRGERLPSTPWHKTIIAGTVGWPVVFFGVVAIPETLWGLLFLLTWLALPTAIFLDSRRIADITDWPKYTWLYVFTSIFWFVAVLPGHMYLWRRQSARIA